MTPAVRISRLRFRYPGSTYDTLRIDALEIPHRGMTAILGPSGAGKSTMVELLATTLREPYHGSIEVLGTDIGLLQKDSDRQRHLRRVGFIPQDFGLLPGRTVEGLLEQDLADSGVPHDERWWRIGGALDKVGLSQMAGRSVDQLSGGQRQRVAIARMLARDVDLVIADEPSANLDASLAGDVIALFRILADTIPVLIVTHDGTIAAGCDRSIVLQPVAIVRAAQTTTRSQHRRRGMGATLLAGAVALMLVVLASGRVRPPDNGPAVGGDTPVAGNSGQNSLAVAATEFPVPLAAVAAARDSLSPAPSEAGGTKPVLQPVAGMEASAIRKLAALGYTEYPPDRLSTGWDTTMTLYVMIGTGRDRLQHAFFFVSGVYVGMDLSGASARITLGRTGTDTIELVYATVANSAGTCCSTRTQGVRFEWDGIVLRTLDPVPSAQTRGVGFPA